MDGDGPGWLDGEDWRDMRAMLEDWRYARERRRRRNVFLDSVRSDVVALVAVAGLMLDAIAHFFG